MARREKSGSKYTDHERRKVVSVWVVTGQDAKTSQLTGIPATTITHWRNHAEWWDSLVIEARAVKKQEWESVLTGAFDLAVGKLIERVETGDAVMDKDGEIIGYKPVTARDLGTISGILYDKSALLRGDPTSRSERGNTDAQLARLAEAFRDASRAGPRAGPKPNNQDDTDTLLH